MAMDCQSMSFMILFIRNQCCDTIYYIDFDIMLLLLPNYFLWEELKIEYYEYYVCTYILVHTLCTYISADIYTVRKGDITMVRV